MAQSSDAATAAWLARIGCPAPARTDLDGLRAVLRAHSCHIPFEHFDALAVRPPALDRVALQRKLIDGRRGGWCFEHACFLQSALSDLGFDARPLPARVLWEQPIDAQPAAEHLVLAVALDGAHWLVDAGYGRLTLTAPLRLEAGVEQQTPHGRYRLVAEAGTDLRLEAALERGWAPLYRLHQRTWASADYAAVNLRLAQDPASRFRQNLFMARAGADGTRHSLRNGRYLCRHADGRVDAQTVPDLAALQPLVQSAFGIDLQATGLLPTLAPVLQPLLQSPP